MAVTSGLLSKSKQLYGAQIIFPKEHGVLVRYFSKEAPSKALKGDGQTYLSKSQRIKYTINAQTQGAQDARTYLLTLQEIRIKRGLTDDLGAEAMMFEALDKVEKEMKKSLMRNDKKGMSCLMEEFDKINKKLGISRNDLPKYEEQLENNFAKAQLEELKKDVLEAMETQKKNWYYWSLLIADLSCRYGVLCTLVLYEGGIQGRRNGRCEVLGHPELPMRC